MLRIDLLIATLATVCETVGPAWRRDESGQMNRNKILKADRNLAFQ
jgi:hypothetical protein